MLLILLTLFIQQLYLFITKRRPDVLACGLWCYCGKEPAEAFKLRILAMFNQTRGDHSTGLCVDDLIIKDTIPAKEFIIKHRKALTFANYDLTNNTILGHCRQATHMFDKSKLGFAHPHAGKQNGVDFLRLVHNGTITNYRDLAKKYDIDTVDKSDSIVITEVLAKAFDNKFDGKENKHPLQEYEGAATVVFYPIRYKNTLYVHRDLTRELFYWQESADRMYISSIKDSLLFLGADPATVKEFISGWLYKIINGRIVKKWDLSTKTPYSTPRPKSMAAVTQNFNYHQDCNVNNRYSPVMKKTNRDGFYFEKHTICHNGHVYTGEMFVEKNGNRTMKKPQDYEFHKFDRYFVIAGIVMKDKKKYEELFTLCLKDNVFDPGQFKKLLPSKIQDYAMYPIVGRTFNSNNDLVVWSDQLQTLTERDSTYEWSPILSNMVFKANRAGFITTSVPREVESTKLTFLEAVDAIIARKLETRGSFKNVSTLFDAYKGFVKDSQLDFDQFLTQMVLFFKTGGNLPEYMINEMEECDNKEISGLGRSELPEMLTQALKLYQIMAPDLGGVGVTEDNTQDLTEQLDQLSDGEALWSTQDFKNDVLFEDWDTLKDLVDNFAPASSPRYKNRFFHQLAKIFHEIGYITADQMYKIKENPVDVNQIELGKIYSNFRQEKCVGLVSNILEEGMTTEGFAMLHERYENLDLQIGKTRREEVESSILKLGMSYILSKSTKVDKRKLLMDYNISKAELDEICS